MIVESSARGCAFRLPLSLLERRNKGRIHASSSDVPTSFGWKILIENVKALPNYNVEMFDRQKFRQIEGQSVNKLSRVFRLFLLNY